MMKKVFIYFREFLFIAVLLIMGFLLLAAIPLKDNEVYVENKIRYYNDFGKEFDLGSYMEFSRNIQNPDKRMEIFNMISQTHDLGTFDVFSLEVAGPTFSQNLYHPASRLFDKSTGLMAWYILLSPLVIFGIIRGVMFSISKILDTARSL
jgi:hypothetical protein